MGLEQAEQLVGDLLAVEDPARGLRDDAFDQRQIMVYRGLPDLGLEANLRRESGLKRGRLQVVHGAAGDLDEVPVQLLPSIARATKGD